MAKKQLTYALVVAGGKGRRMRKKIPKQFLKISGIPILIHTLLPFERSPIIDGIVVVLPQKWHTRGKILFKSHGIKKVVALSNSGISRQASVYNGLLKIAEYNPNIVIIHDAVRPFISQKMIHATYKSAKRHGAATAGIPVPDTVYHKGKGVFLEKKAIVKIQTPQAFKFRLIFEAHLRARKRKKWDFPDDTSLLSFYRRKFVIVTGDAKNIKITDSEDLTLARALLKEPSSSK